MRYLLFIIISLSIFFNHSAFSYESYIVLKINNRIITNIDIDNEYRYLIALNKDLESIDKKTIMRLAKDSIIREKIKETEINIYYDLSKKNKFIDKIIENFYKKLGMQNEKEFKNYLSSYDLLLKDVKKKISIEAAWNDLVYQKFADKIKIDEIEIRKRLKNQILNKKKQNMYLLSEIMFNLESSENINSKYELIKKSISEIGFKSTANLYSISDSSKLGGQIGWVYESQLSKIIEKEIVKITTGQYTVPIIIPGGFLILNIDDKKVQEEKINFNEELKKQITFEKNTQLDQFSKVYFNKIKKNSMLDE